MIFYITANNRTPLYGQQLKHLVITDSFPNKGETTVHGCHCRGEMVLRMRKVLAAKLVRVLQCLNPSLGKASRHIFSKFNPLNTNTPLTRTLSMAPLSVPFNEVSVLSTGFECNLR